MVANLSASSADIHDGTKLNKCPFVLDSASTRKVQFTGMTSSPAWSGSVPLIHVTSLQHLSRGLLPPSNSGLKTGGSPCQRTAFHTPVPGDATSKPPVVPLHVPFFFYTTDGNRSVSPWRYFRPNLWQGTALACKKSKLPPPAAAQQPRSHNKQPRRAGVASVGSVPVKHGCCGQ